MAFGASIAGGRNTREGFLVEGSLEKEMEEQLIRH